MKSTSATAAIGFRAHSGWAVLVAVTESPHLFEVIDRRRIKLADPEIPGSVQPYHAAESLQFAEAERLIELCADSSRRLAHQALRTALDDLRASGYRVTACGLLLASGRPLPDLKSTLASHALIHTAEGELFREVLADASRRCDLPIMKVRERELLERIPQSGLDRRLAELGRALGPPWRQDEKYAALVAYLALGTIKNPADLAGRRVK